MKIFADKNYLKIIFFGLLLRLFYLISKVGEITKINLGGDPCHHFNIALNISKFIGPKTNFIFSYWHHHNQLPAFTDVYPPGFHIFASLFLIINDHFFTGRIVTIAIYIINFIIIILISNHLNNKKLGYITAFFISLNFFHIENSVVFMTVNFYCLLISVYFYVYLLTLKNNYFFLLLGFLISYSSITFGGWQILLIISFIYIFIKQSNKLQSLILLLIGFAPIYLYWSYVTNDYFGTSFYSNLKFYPYVNDWADMMHSKQKPILSEFLSNIDFVEFVKNHFIWAIQNLIKFSFITFPSFLFFFGFLTLPIILFSSLKLKELGLPLITFILLYLFGIFFASYSMSGVLWPRHFMSLLFPVSILIAYSLIKFENKYNLLSLSRLKIDSILILSASVLLFLISAKSSFWSRDTSHFYEMGKYINQNEIDNIMYGLTVQDLWCVSKKNIIMDPVFNLSLDSKRAINEINHYGVEYLLIDLSDDIYFRSSKSINEILSYYNSKDLNLDLIYQNEFSKYFLYKIN